jgi:inosine/xanthosine triphosphatase
MKIAIGSENPAKLKAAKLAVKKIYPNAKIFQVRVSSNVNDQPKSEGEAIKGAINRASQAQKRLNSDFGIGMEGGIHRIGKKWFECGWIAVVNKKGKIGLGSSARFEVSEKIHKRLLNGEDLAQVIDDLARRKDIAKKEGAMGVLTKGHLPRHKAYSHGIIFAFAPFISNSKYWD